MYVCKCISLPTYIECMYARSITILWTVLFLISFKLFLEEYSIHWSWWFVSTFEMEILSSFELCSTMPTYPVELGNVREYIVAGTVFMNGCILLVVSINWHQICRRSNVQKKYFQRETMRKMMTMIWFWYSDVSTQLSSYWKWPNNSSAYFIFIFFAVECVFISHFYSLLMSVVCIFSWWESKKFNSLPEKIKLIYILKFGLGPLFYSSLWHTQILRNYCSWDCSCYCQFF